MTFKNQEEAKRIIPQMVVRSRTLPMLIKKQILRNLRDHWMYFPDVTIPSTYGELITGYFSWATTEQGHSYWSGIRCLYNYDKINKYKLIQDL